MRAFLYIIPIILLFAVSCYGTADVRVADTVRVVDATPKTLWDRITDRSTIVLAVFTVVLAVATGFYTYYTAKNVKVSKDLLASNREFSDASNNMVRAQLLGRLYELSHSRGWGEAGLVDRDLGPAIRVHLNRAAADLLGEPYKRKVRVKLKDNYSGTRSLFHINCKPGQPMTIPLLLWDVFVEVTHGADDNFEFLGYVESEESSEQDKGNSA